LSRFETHGRPDGKVDLSYIRRCIRELSKRNARTKRNGINLNRSLPLLGLQQNIVEPFSVLRRFAGMRAVRKIGLRRALAILGQRAAIRIAHVSPEGDLQHLIDSTRPHESAISAAHYRGHRCQTTMPIKSHDGIVL
jgi:hypothetical protein